MEFFGIWVNEVFVFVGAVGLALLVSESIRAGRARRAQEKLDFPRSFSDVREYARRDLERRDAVAGVLIVVFFLFVLFYCAVEENVIEGLKRLP